MKKRTVRLLALAMCMVMVLALVPAKAQAVELDAKNIDVVWNGMTLTDAVVAAMNCTNPYCNNAQVVITK